MAEGAEQEDKTEEPTQRRLDQAIERGDVATSAEINTFAILGAFTLALVIAAPTIAQNLTQGLKAYLANRASTEETFLAFTRRHEFDVLKTLFEQEAVE